MVSLRQLGMTSGKQLRKFNHIIVALAHFLTIYGNHIIVHPVVDGGAAVGNSTLCYFALMVRELQIHATSVDIKALTQILAAHSRALNMPAGIAYSPWASPSHYMLWSCFFP